MKKQNIQKKTKQKTIAALVWAEKNLETTLVSVTEKDNKSVNPPHISKRKSKIMYQKVEITVCLLGYSRKHFKVYNKFLFNTVKEKYEIFQNLYT